MINFKHLHYFWVVAKAGGVIRAGEQLHTTPQTLSAQIKLLEDRLGRQLLRKSGRKLELTDDGRVALRYADEIFALSSELEAALRGKPTARDQVVEFRVGIEESVAKVLAYRLLEPALQLPQTVRLSVTEGHFGDLMADLALHRLDLVLADEPLTSRLSVKAFNHKLGSSPVSFCCAPALAARLKGRFPECLNGAPMLMPGGSSSVRPQLDAWLVQRGLSPATVGDFGDDAMMKAFGQHGSGIFVSPSVVDEELCRQHGVEVIGRADDISADFYAISVERRITHPGVAAVTQAARDGLFSATSGAGTGA